MNLAGRACLVTGGASGIGRAIAASLEAAGAEVLIADLERAPILVDLSRPGSAAQMIHETSERLGRLDVLVNNAGGYSPPTYPASENWRDPLELNLGSVMEAIKHALPLLARTRGCVVNISSSAALGVEPYDGVEYAVAKAGIVRLTTALAEIEGVRVNCVCPHTVATDSVLKSLATRSLAEIAPPPATLLQVEEVCSAVMRFIEDDSLAGRVTILTGGEEPRLL